MLESNYNRLLWMVAPLPAILTDTVSDQGLLCKRYAVGISSMSLCNYSSTLRVTSRLVDFLRNWDFLIELPSLLLVLAPAISVSCIMHVESCQFRRVE